MRRTTVNVSGGRRTLAVVSGIAAVATLFAAGIAVASMRPDQIGSSPNAGVVTRSALANAPAVVAPRGTRLAGV